MNLIWLDQYRDSYQTEVNFSFSNCQKWLHKQSAGPIIFSWRFWRIDLNLLFQSTEIKGATLLNAKTTKALQITMHFRNWGQDIVTSASATWHQWFWAWLFLKNISIILSSHFLSTLPLGRRFPKPPTDGNAKRYVPYCRTTFTAIGENKNVLPK